MRIRVISPSDDKIDEIWWSDYWVKKDLETEFVRHGYEIVKNNADLDFYLFGDYSHLKNMTALRKFCWLYSHPDKVSKELINKFEHIFIPSRTYLSKINNSSLLLGASSKEFTPRKKEAKYDIVFVGNAGKPNRVAIIEYLIKLKKYKILIAGEGWDEKLKEQIKNVDYMGPYTDNNKLGEFFNQGLLSFYAAYEDMRREGFVAIRILDIFRSSENLCISDNNIGLKDIFRHIPTYTSKEELIYLIDWFLQHPDERKEIALRCRVDAKQRTFTNVVTEIKRWINIR